MNKSFNERKIKYKKKNKKGKIKYKNHKNQMSLHKPVRNYVKSYLNKYKKNKIILENFIYPSKINKTSNWWDCKPFKPKCFKIH